MAVFAFVAAFFTVTLQVYFLPPTFAVMVAVPAFFAVTTPFLLTTATFFLLEDQVAFLLLPSTCRLVVCPIFSVAFFLLMDVFALAAAGNASTKIMILSRSSIRFLVLFIFSLLLRVNILYTAQYNKML